MGPYFQVFHKHPSDDVRLPAFTPIQDLSGAFGSLCDQIRKDFVRMMEDLRHEPDASIRRMGDSASAMLSQDEQFNPNVLAETVRSVVRQVVGYIFPSNWSSVG